jgi:hypothetical protein
MMLRSIAGPITQLRALLCKAAEARISWAVQDEMQVRASAANRGRSVKAFSTLSPAEWGRQLARQTITLLYMPKPSGPLISDCLSGGPVPVDSGCPVHPRWRRIQAMIVHEMEGVTLEQLGLDAHSLALNK